MLDALLVLWSTILDWSNDIAGFLAVVTLVAQIWVLLRLRSLKKAVLRMGRAGPLAKNIERHATTISQLLQDFDANRVEIRKVLATALPTARSIRDKFVGYEKTVAKKLVIAITDFLGTRRTWLPSFLRKSQDTEEACRRVHEEMLVLTETLKGSTQDSKFKW